MVKIQKSSNTGIEKVLTITGLALIIFGSVSSLFYLLINQRFINDATSWVALFYYTNYLVTLGGGFAAGYLLTKGKKSSRLFNGVVYALLTTLFYFLFSALQFLISITIGNPTYPWGMLLFTGAPAYALVIVALTAYFLQYRTKQTELSVKVRQIFIVAFLSYQIYTIANDLYYVFVVNTTAYTASPILVVASYLLNPLVVAVIAYTLLSKVRSRLNRLFYASFIGNFSYIFMLTLWNFQTNPFVDAVTQFQIFSAITVALATGFVIWKSRRVA